MSCALPDGFLHGRKVVVSRCSRAPAWLIRCLSVSMLLIAGCDFPGRPNLADRPVRPDEIVDFARLYGQNCAGCHGVDGKMGPAPPLNDSLFRLIVPEVELENVITNGRNKTLMPAFAKENGGALTRAQIQTLVLGIKGRPYGAIREQGRAVIQVVADAGGTPPLWGSPGKLPAGAPCYQVPSTSATEPKPSGEVEGISAFARACAACHGDQGQGIAQGDVLIHTINDSAFLSTCSNQVLRRYIITGRPDLGMPGYADARPGHQKFQPLTDCEVASLVALLASWRSKDVIPEQIQTSRK